AVVITAFFTFHIWLIVKQYTTIEFCEKRSDGDSNFVISPYNIGCYNNLKTVLGNNILLWFVPFCKTIYSYNFIGPNHQGEGLMFEVRNELKANQFKLL